MLAILLVNVKLTDLFIFFKISFADLSFNNIEVIEGLNNLSKIQDLTLYSNKIKKIENMDALKELHMFSIGSNEIQDIKDVKISVLLIVLNFI